MVKNSGLRSYGAKSVFVLERKPTMRKKYFAAFWQLFRGFWQSEEKWRARGLLAVVISLNFASVYLLVQINTWYNDFYNALQNYEEQLFWPLVGEFTALAFVYIIIAVYAIYLRQLVQIKWRTWMTKEYLARWLNNRVYYRMQLTGSDTDNPDQRISEDINQFVNLTLQLLIGFLKQLTTLAAFGVVLWNLSGVFTVPLGSYSFQIYGYMFWFSLAYSTVGTVFAHLVGRKLIGLNFDQQRYEADFRFGMMRLRENSESVAFYGGEKAEGEGFREKFVAVIKNFRELMNRTKLLNFYVNGYAQLAVIVPLVMAAPQYFSGAMALGGLMQTVSAFGRVQDALSYFVESYDTIAQLASVIRRLEGFTEHMEDAQNATSGIKIAVGAKDALTAQNLNINIPTGENLLKNCSVEFLPKVRWLVTGASGCGKSTLLRALAGIWPFGSGTINFPAKGETLFLPQKPYLPLGSLRRAIYYPNPERRDDDENLRQKLQKVGLAHFAERLDDVDDWSRILSLGEQQRLAFVRVLLIRPQRLILDEATSALDEPYEKAMYELLREELPNMSIISVGHRSTLFAAHDENLSLKGNGEWTAASITT